MIKKLFTLVCAAIVSYNCSAQTLTILQGQSVSVNSLSRNGKWAFASDNKGAYTYNVTTDEIAYFTGAYISDVSDNGTFAGSMDGKAAIFKDGEWIYMPLPDNPIIAGTNSVRGISADENVLVGHVNTIKDGRKPCVWTKTGEYYLAELLPAMEKDLTGRVPQGIDGLFCSATGDVLAGRMVDKTGFYNMMISWKKGANNQWEYQLLGKDFIFKEGEEIPTVPETPNYPNPKSYYSKADSAAYDQAVLDFNAGLITENPSWKPEKFISNSDKLAEYNQNLADYKVAIELWNKQTALLHAASTGKGIDAFCNYISGNGKYLTATCGAYDEESDKDIKYPIYFNIETGKTIELPNLGGGDCIVVGVTDAGDLIYATPYRSPARTSFIVPEGTQKPMDMAEWTMEGTNGALNIRPDFSFTFDSFDPVTGMPISAVDSLIVGSVSASSNGRIFLGTFFETVSRSQMTYIVDMGPATNIDNVGSTSEIVIYPNPVIDVLYLKGDVQQVSIVDLTGRMVYQSSSVSDSISMGSFGRGTYLVKLSSGGKTTIYKVVVTN